MGVEKEKKKVTSLYPKCPKRARLLHCFVKKTLTEDACCAQCSKVQRCWMRRDVVVYLITRHWRTLCADTVGRKTLTVSDTVGLCGATINGLCAARPDCVAQTWGQIPDCYRKSGQCGAEPAPKSGLCAVSAGLCGATERLCVV